MGISLASITRDPVLAPPRIIIYGPHKIGKTSFATSAPNPIVLQTEDGLGNLNVSHFPLLKSYREVIEALSCLYYEDHNYQTCVIDSLDWLEPMVWMETAQKHNKPDIEDFGYGKGYLFACDQWRTLLGWLNALREQKNMAVIMTAHCHVKAFNDPSSEPYDRYLIKLQDRASSLVQEWADAILFANFKATALSSSTGSGASKKTRTRAIGSGERVIYTEERPSHLAGNRYSLPFEIPFEKNTGWETFQNLLINN